MTGRIRAPLTKRRQTLSTLLDGIYADVVTGLCKAPSPYPLLKKDMLLIASNHNTEAGLVTVLKYQEGLGNFSVIQTIPCYYCSFADLGRFEDEIFIVIMSESSDFIYIGRYDRNQGRFVLFQNLNLARPQEAFFYNRDGSLSLSVLAEIEQRKEIFTFQYQGNSLRMVVVT